MNQTEGCAKLSQPLRSRYAGLPRLTTIIVSVLIAALMGALSVGISLARDGSVMEVRIAAQRLDDGRTEFALQVREGDGWGERIMPQRRMFPATTAKDALNRAA